MAYLKADMSAHGQVHKGITMVSPPDVATHRCVQDLIQVYEEQWLSANAPRNIQAKKNALYISQAKRDECSNLVASSVIQLGRITKGGITSVEVAINMKVYAAVSISANTGHLAYYVRLALQESLRTGKPIPVSIDKKMPEQSVALVAGTVATFGGQKTFTSSIPNATNTSNKGKANNNSNTTAFHVVPTKTCNHSGSRNNNNNRETRSNANNPTFITNNHRGVAAADTPAWPPAVILVQWKTRLALLKRHRTETLQLLSIRDEMRMRLAVLDLKAAQGRQLRQEQQELDRELEEERQQEEKKPNKLREQYRQQQQKEKEALFPRPLVQPGYGQPNVDSVFFGQAQPQCWY
ncbi:hypothetical protein BGW39_004245 [Mortierella sp. 14UC]|nr:hypothetical protein BGW39_004245 [Mortierella sp. 14UC]